MLKSVELRNFKSFHNKVKIDFEKTNYKTLLNTNVSGNLLKGALFVGKNASGKSNVLKAIRFLLECLLAKNEVNCKIFYEECRRITIYFCVTFNQFTF